MIRRLLWMGAAGAVCLWGSVLLARQGVVKTTDGKTMEGDIEEKPDQVIVTMHGIKTTINRDNVVGQVEYFDNVEARYQAKAAQLPKNATAADHLALARWCFDVKAYDLALKEIDEVRKIDPNSADAQTLEQTVTSQRRIEKARATGPGATGTGTTGTGPGTGTTAKPPTTRPTVPTASGDKSNLLTAKEINTIRQVEWRKDDANPPRAIVPPAVRKRYVELKAINPGDFAALSMPEQAYVILTDPQTPNDMRGEIKITSDPQALAEYRRTIQPLVLNNCATIGCHGGHNAPKFFLYANNPERDEVAYTDFFILQNYKRTINEKEYLMVDRTYPERSILSQFALALDVAEVKHPKIEGQAYKPIAANKQAPSYRTFVEWMKGLQAGGPTYGIDFDPATGLPRREAAKPDGVKPDKTKPETPKPAGTGQPSGTKGGAGGAKP